MTPLRILMTTDTVGGVWTFTRQLTEFLVADGHTVVLVSFGGFPSQSQCAWVRRMEQSAGERFCFEALDEPLEWMQENGRAFGSGALRLLRLAERFRVDLLHANQFCWGALPGSLPRLVTAHSDVLSWADACKPEALVESPWLSRYTNLVQRGLAACDAVVTPTRWMLDALCRNFVACGAHQVIANGRSFQIPQRERRLQAVSAGRLWDEAKGIDELAEVNSPWPLIIAGQESFDGAVATPGLLRAAGVLQEEELLTLFAESSVYLAGSRYEPFGLAPLEAAMCGCAVVARDIPSLREVWDDGAIYFTSRVSLETILRKFADDPGVLEDVRVRSVKRARLYTAERMTADYVQVYRQVVAGSLATGAALAYCSAVIEESLA